MSIKDIQNKAKEIIISNNSDVITAYIIEKLDREPSAQDINRTGGAPIGISEKLWPTFEGEKMDHAITIDLSTSPMLKSNFSDDVKAIAVFVSDLLENEAFEPGTEETAVVFLSEKDLANGVSDWQPQEGEVYENFESNTFITHEVDLPSEVFNENIYELDDNDPVLNLFEELSSYSMIGGKPIWIQSPEYEGDIILQFDDCLVDMNLGDAGFMYVFEDTAFWQCH